MPGSAVYYSQRIRFSTGDRAYLDLSYSVISLKNLAIALLRFSSNAFAKLRVQLFINHVAF